MDLSVVGAAFLGAAGATAAGWVAGTVAGKNALTIERERHKAERTAAAEHADDERRRALADLRRPLYEQLVTWSLRFVRWVELTNPLIGFGIDPGEPPTDEELMPWRAQLEVVGSPTMATRLNEWQQALREFGDALAYLRNVEAQTRDERPEPEPWKQLEEKRVAVRAAYSALTNQAARDVQSPAYETGG